MTHLTIIQGPPASGKSRLLGTLARSKDVAFFFEPTVMGICRSIEGKNITVIALDELCFISGQWRCFLHAVNGQKLVSHRKSFDYYQSCLKNITQIFITTMSDEESLQAIKVWGKSNFTKISLSEYRRT